MSKKSGKPTVALRTPDEGEAPPGIVAFVAGTKAPTSAGPLAPARAPVTPRAAAPSSETAKQPDSQAAGQPDRPMVNGRVLLPRKDGQNVRRMTIYMKPELAAELAMARAQTGKDISEMIGVAVEAYLSARRAK